MAVYADLALWAMDILKADSSITDAVMDGAAAIVESGALNAKPLEERQRARREAGTPGKVLEIMLWDRGEREWREYDRASFFSVLVYDRGSGYTNIRTLRYLIVQALVGEPAALERDAFVTRVSWLGRSGHQRFEQFNLDYERLDFIGPLVIEADVYRS